MSTDITYPSADKINLPINENIDSKKQCTWLGVVDTGVKITFQ